MNPKKLIVGLLPWIVFGVLINRAGVGAAGLAAFAAAALAVVLLIRDRQHGIKIIDVTGIAVFGVLAIIAILGGPDASSWVADFGRGGATAVVALVMLASAVTVPFSEQYARESVPREYWGSPTFRAVNRKISALWGALLLVVAGSHVLAGWWDPAGSVGDGAVNPAGPSGLLLNWVVPVALVLLGAKLTTTIAAGAHHPAVPAGR